MSAEQIQRKLREIECSLRGIFFSDLSATVEKFSNVLII